MSDTDYPTNLDSFVNPSGSDDESAPPVPHHLQHGMANDAIAALQTKVGVDSSTVQTTIDYLVKTAANPGHIHTNSMSIKSLTVTGTDVPSGAGVWTDGTSVFLTTKGPSGGVILRPNGQTSTHYQFSVSATGVVASSNSSGTTTNVFDDGSGNMTIIGNATIEGALTVDGEFTTGSFDFGTPSNSAVNDANSEGVSSELARADHVHGREGFTNTLPVADSSSPTAGTSPHPARADHVHPLVDEIAGVIKLWPAASAPNGYLLCTGQAISRTTYANLFSAIGTTWGSGDGSTTFNIPDMRGAAPVGVGTGTASGGGSLTARVLATKYGAETHVLTTGEMPNHTHTGPSHTHTGPSHNHSGATGGQSADHTHSTPSDTAINFSPSSLWLAGSGSNTVTFSAQTSGGTSNNHTHSISSDGTGATGSSGTGATGSAGSGSAHSILQPIIALNFIIKY